MYLRSKAPTFRVRCSRVWLRASGRASWRYALRSKLPRGSYTLYSRAVAGGVVQSPPTRVTFTVR
jgi:hypothetical protein